MEQSAKELGFKPEFKQMSKDQTENFITVLMGGEPRTDLPESELPFTLRILNKRLEVMGLPITITEKAKWLLWVLTEQNPGKINIALIDCLTKYENKTVDENKVVHIYPNGFYTDDSFIEYVDKYVKTRKVKWSEIY